MIRRKDIVEEVFIMNEPQTGQPMTLDEYEKVPEEIRLEIIDGIVKRMDAPNVMHQDLVGELFAEIRNFIKNTKKPCKAMISPCDVLLSKKEERKKPTVVQPDVFVVCDRDRLGKQYCYGGPDWAIEILSPGNSKHDLIVKLNLYLKAGVKEYWVVDPKNETVFVYLFNEDGGMDLKSYRFKENIPVGLYDGELQINIMELLQEL